MTVNQITAQMPEAKTEQVKKAGASQVFSALIDCLMANAESCTAGRVHGDQGLQGGKGAGSSDKTAKQRKAADDTKKEAPGQNTLCTGMAVSILQCGGLCTGAAANAGLVSMQQAQQAGKTGKAQNGVSGVTDMPTNICSPAGKNSGLAADNAVLQAAVGQGTKSAEGISQKYARPAVKTAGSLAAFSLHETGNAGGLTPDETDLESARASESCTPQAEPCGTRSVARPESGGKQSVAPQPGRAALKTETNVKAAVKAAANGTDAKNISGEVTYARQSGSPDSLPYANGIAARNVTKSAAEGKHVLTGNVPTAQSLQTAGKDDAGAEPAPLDGRTAFADGARAARTVSSGAHTDNAASAATGFAFPIAAGTFVSGREVSDALDGAQSAGGRISGTKEAESVDAAHGMRPVTAAHAEKASKKREESTALQNPEEKRKVSSEKDAQGGVPAQSAQGGANDGLSARDIGQQQDVAKSIVQKTADAALQTMKAGKSTMHFHLSPEKLGGITIHMVSRGGSLFMKMTADVQDTGRMLAGGLSDLNRSLQQSGVSVGKTEVLLTNGGNMGFTGSSHAGADAQGGRQAYTQRNLGTAEYNVPFRTSTEVSAPVFSKISILA